MEAPVGGTEAPVGGVSCECDQRGSASIERGGVSCEHDRRGSANNEHGSVSYEHDRGRFPILMDGRKVLQMVAWQLMTSGGQLRIGEVSGRFGGGTERGQ